MSPGLSGFVLADRHDQQEQDRDHRWQSRQSRHRRIHLRQGPPVRRSRLRPRSPALTRHPDRSERRRTLRVGLVGTGPGSRRDRHAGGQGAVGRRDGAAVLLRRIQWASDPVHGRRAALPAVWRIAPGAHRLRGADLRGQSCALRQDGVGGVPGLRARPADRDLGRESLGILDPSGALHPRGAAPGRDAGRGRSEEHAPGPSGRSSPRREARHRRGRGPLSPSIPLRERPGRSGLPGRTHAGRGQAARASAGMDIRARRRDLRRHGRRAATVR